jgi:hypothetical protein
VCESSSRAVAPHDVQMPVTCVEPSAVILATV